MTAGAIGAGGAFRSGACAGNAMATARSAAVAWAGSADVTSAEYRRRDSASPERGRLPTHGPRDMLAAPRHRTGAMHRVLRSAAVLAAAAVSTIDAQQIVGTRDSLALRVDSVFRAFDRTDAPGCAVGVYREG